VTVGLGVGVGVTVGLGVCVGLGVGVGATTVKVTELLVIPDRDAVIMVLPAVAPAAKPLEEMLAMPVLELFQVTWEVRSC